MSKSSRQGWGYKGISIIAVSFLAMVFLLLATGLSWAGSYNWTESGPFGGPPTAGGMSPNYAFDQEMALCAGGAVYRSQDKGASWTKVYSQYFGGWIYSPAYAIDHTIFAFDDTKLYRIISWGTPAKLSTPFAVVDLAISPNYAVDRTILICGGVWNSDTNSYTGAGGIAKSTNGGSSWSMIYSGFGTTGGCVTPGRWWRVYLPPNYHNTDSSGLHHQIVYADGSCGYRSYDGGTTWAVVGRPSDSAMIFPPDFSTSNKKIYAYSKNHTSGGPDPSGLYWSTDGGDTWPGANFLAGPPTTPASDTQFIDNFSYFSDGTPANDRIYGAGCWWNGDAPAFQGGLYYVDGLTTTPAWHALGSPTGDPYAIALVMSPDFIIDQTVVIVTLNGFYISTDSGTTFTLSPTGHKSYQFSHGVGSDPANNASVTYFIASKGGGVFKSTTNGWAWTQKNTGLGSHVVTALGISRKYNGTTDQILFAACGKEADPYDAKSRLIYRSIDGGDNWTLAADVEAQLDGDFISFFVIPPDYDGSANQTLFFHTDGKECNSPPCNPKVFKSVNNGDTWGQYNPSALGGLEGIYTATLTPGIGTDNWVLAGYDYSTFGSDIFASPDKGVTWVKQNSTTLFTIGQTNHSTGPMVPPGVVGDTTILMSLSRKGIAHTGIYRSTDLGATWNEVKSFNYETKLTPTWYRNSPADGGKSVIFFSTVWDKTPSSSNHGIYKSVDGGATWARVGKDVTGFNSTGGIHYNPVPPGNNSTGSTLFALGGQYFGLWQYSFMSLVLTAPADVSTTYDGCAYYSLPTFTWDRIGEPAYCKKWEIRFSADSNFLSYVKAPLVWGTPSYTPTTSVWKKVMLLPLDDTVGGTVYWRVVATMKDNSLAPSVPFSFTINAPVAVDGINISPTSKASLPTLSWNNNCNKKFKVWFGNASDFTLTTTKKKALTFNVADPNASPVFSLLLTSGQWTAIQSVVGGIAPNTIYYYIEAWDAANRHTQTEAPNAVSANFTLSP
jgi:hypothetical protein